jgi:3,4-dihydroxy 2-butanone 4-phosphate synthase/GTP cyclohydrolase II
VSRAALARAAGLHPNSLRKLGTSDWNPTADTLMRLEKLLQRGTTEVLVGTETIIDEARNGRMFILVDDEGRENEGDLVIPAQMATPEAINFMARHGRGLICLALTKERADQLGLEPMTRTNRSRNETAFTVSIEAKEGISTGISAADRARTIAVAIDAAHGPDSLVSPGHGLLASTQAPSSARSCAMTGRWPASTTSPISLVRMGSRSARSAISSLTG